MTSIYPFHAITPLNYKAPLQLSNEPNDKQLLKFHDLLAQKILSQHAKDSFYCCKISNTNFSLVGLVALIDSSLVNRCIFQHEKCIPVKQNIYFNSFIRHNTQLAPIILLHKDNLEIKNSLKEFTRYNTSFLKIQVEGTTYELWSLENTSFYKKLYSNLNIFWLADGHHRISAINDIRQNSLISAFLVSVNDILSGVIYREYLKVDEASKQSFNSFLMDHFHISQTQDINYNNFIFRLDADSIYTVHNTNTEYARRKILSFLDNLINYDKEQLNFYNCLNQNSFIFNHNKDRMALLIPAYKFPSQIGTIELLPPHSTMLYPKLPNGLISNYIISDKATCTSPIGLEQVI